MQMKKNLTALCLAALMALPCAGALAIEYDLESQGSEVALIQSALLELDYYYGDVTQHYGTRTQRGVRLFQREYGLEPTGVADDTTRALLYEITGTTPPDTGDMLLEMNITLRRGDTGSDVVWLQESLAALGHYDGEISGNYGNLTKEAVRLFQRANDLASDGVAGKNTIRAIAYAVKAQQEAERFEQTFSGMDEGAVYGDIGDIGYAEPTEDPESITTLKLGVRNSAVRRLQEDLEALGFYTGVITGNYGNLTKEAVRLFQRANDIPSDGVAGPITLAEIAEEMADLRALEAALLATPVPTAAPQIPAPTPDRYGGLVEFITPAPKPTATPVRVTATPVRVTATPRPVSGVNSSAGFLNIQRELKLYDNNEEVRQLQIALNSLGYYSGEKSGYFDLMTRAAVMGYQAAKGIKVSGDADKITLITINDDIFRRYANVVD